MIGRGRSLRGLGPSLVLALGLGASIFATGMLLSGDFHSSWFTPAFDLAAVTLLVVAAALGGLDASLRRDSRSLPVVLLAGFGLIVWIAHLVSYVGILPGPYGGEAGRLPRWLFAVLTVATPAILALTLLHWARSLERPLNAVLRASLAGLGLGVLALAAGLALAVLVPAGRATEAQTLLGVLGLAAVATGLVLILTGFQGDERIVSGVGAGLVVSAFASAGLLLEASRFTPLWYADHALATLPFAALLAGQLSIYERSVSAERASEARLRAIFEGSAMAIALVDARGRLLEVNARAEEITGFRRLQLRGMAFAELLAGEQTAADLTAFAELRRGQRTEHEADIRLRTESGDERWLRVIISRFPAAAPGGPYFIAMGHDISEQRRFQAQLEDASQRLASAARMRGGVELVSELAGSLEITQIANRLVARAVTAVDADRCTLLGSDEAGMVAEASFDRKERPPWIGRHFSTDYLLSQPLLRAALEKREAILGGRLEMDEVMRDFGDLVRRVKHTAVLPLLVGDDIAGLLIVSRSSDQPFTTEDVDVLRLIGNVAALALRNARLYAGAQEASQSKTLFLNMAAHELRTPLTVILGYISLLLEGSLGPPSASWRSTIELLDAKTRELGSLVDGILVAARLEEGPISLPMEDLEIGAAVREAVRRAQPRAWLSRAEVGVEVAGSGLAIKAHRESLDRILDNLLNNAIAYSLPGAHIRVVAASGGGEVVISVADDGVGIPADMRERIFERLVRLDQPGLGYPSGTGLGLFISRSLAERMNGSLVLAWSRPGQGSTFELRLPRSEPAVRRRRQREAPAAAAGG